MPDRLVLYTKKDSAEPKSDTARKDKDKKEIRRAVSAVISRSVAPLDDTRIR